MTSILNQLVPKLPKGDQILVDKILSEERLTREEGVQLFHWSNLNLLGTLANLRREKLHGNRAYFIQNQHLNNTNICVLHCKFCSFRRTDGEDGAYSYTEKEIYDRIRKTKETGVREVHIVNGLHPHLLLDFYEKIFRGIKEIHPELHIKAFTAVEIDFFARREKLSIEDVFHRLIAAGLDSLPGGGAEIFADRVHQEICGEKIGGDRWLEIHKIAHQMGLRSTCTMLYGHVETYEERIDHMFRLRELQDETKGFTCFIPLRFHLENNPLGARENLHRSETLEDLRNYAVARLFLDNIEHLKAYWIMAGCDTARLALHYGCDDLDGTIQEEIITHMAGCETPIGLNRQTLLNMIRQAGRDPVERDTLYQDIHAANPQTVLGV